ncbi:hypothetical protein HELRODRAFT_163836 [Helobdella robusta]|uniref:Uncharacterized protein n=1 Tax=Helobdella robusta TaxID=6412 RepID=T1EUJ0_HELRO|nr:hypothetical protein HELRODRAFT_163836 [Helobdella robusta]ESN96733.1 hypothetical protein HELRODRAFT_163836 [Helobdella robusta]
MAVQSRVDSITLAMMMSHARPVRKSLSAIHKSKFFLKLETVSDSTTHVGKLFQIEITLLENEYFLVFGTFEHVFYSDVLWYVDPHQNTKLKLSERLNKTPKSFTSPQKSKRHTLLGRDFFGLGILLLLTNIQTVTGAGKSHHFFYFVEKVLEMSTSLNSHEALGPPGSHKVTRN